MLSSETALLSTNAGRTPNPSTFSSIWLPGFHCTQGILTSRPVTGLVTIPAFAAFTFAMSMVATRKSKTSGSGSTMWHCGMSGTSSSIPGIHSFALSGMDAFAPNCTKGFLTEPIELPVGFLHKFISATALRIGRSLAGREKYKSPSLPFTVSFAAGRQAMAGIETGGKLAPNGFATNPWVGCPAPIKDIAPLGTATIFSWSQRMASSLPDCAALR